MPGKRLHLVVQDVREDGSALFSSSSVMGWTVTATRYHLGGEGLCLCWFSVLYFETSPKMDSADEERIGRNLIREGMALKGS